MCFGTVFDVREFAVHDGPGVRQTVFLKGCPLRCQWCHNPEGISSQPQLMVSGNGCTGCGKCLAACPKGNGACTACGACTAVCPQGLRSVAGSRMGSAALVHLLQKDAAYYATLGGGVTFSGGEPLMQAGFVQEVAQALPGVHKAVETCGHVEPGVFARTARQMDLVLLDIKQMDSVVHKQYTGVDNGTILQNARWLCGQDIPFVVRIPLIPGVNDDEENLRATAAFLQGAKALQKVELLPYHKTAGAKYAMLGMQYRPQFNTEAPLQPCGYSGVFGEYGIRSAVL